MVQDRVLATYLVETPHSLDHAAAVIAGEQSSGTFVAVPGETNELKERFGAQVVRIEQLDTVAAPSLPGSKPPRSTGSRVEYRRGRITISFPLHNFGPSLSSLLSMVAGQLHGTVGYSRRAAPRRRATRNAEACEVLSNDVASPTETAPRTNWATGR